MYMQSRYTMGLLWVSVFALLMKSLATFGATRMVAVTGARTPDGTSSLVRLGIPVLNDAGQVAFHAELGGLGASEAIFLADTTSLTEIVRAADAVPDGNGVYSSLLLPKGLLSTNINGNDRWRVPRLNGRGEVAFFAELSGVRGRSIEAISVGSATRMDVIAREGDILPGGFGTLRGVDNFSYCINDAGWVSFIASTTGSPTAKVFTRNGDRVFSPSTSEYPFGPTSGRIFSNESNECQRRNESRGKPPV
ncbi:MAG: choice-of-anchor tandem repeat NxxGxxAF-containing protein [Limisphaerales bacterium]